jgi:glycine betaine catabolism B
MKFHAEVNEIVQRSRDVRSIRFAKPGGFDYLPGQFMFITLGGGEAQMTKHFTISSSPTEEHHIEMTKRLTGHPFSDALAALEPGDEVMIEGPHGSFTFNGEYSKVGLLSGGIGITPLRSMIRYSTDKRLDTKIALLYSNRTEDEIAFRDDLDSMHKQNPNLDVMYTLTGPSQTWKGATGRISEEMLVKFVPDFMERVFFTSGPRKMVEAMISSLKNLSVPQQQIKWEYFPGYD